MSRGIVVKATLAPWWAFSGRARVVIAMMASSRESSVAG
jgi:hypothetical protein